MKRVENSLDTKQVLTVVERYSQALNVLDAYDYQNMVRPKGKQATYILTYEECRKVIDSMKFGGSSSLFVVKRMIPLQEVLAQFTKVLQGRIYIQLWRRKRQICYI